jgi:hypothetical protein
MTIRLDDYIRVNHNSCSVLIGKGKKYNAIEPLFAMFIVKCRD